MCARRWWDDYLRAYSDALSHTSTRWAPWHAVPPTTVVHPPLRRRAGARHPFVDIDPQYPRFSEEERRALHEARAELDGETG